ncbi:YdcF family protein [Pseudoalteromonas sp. T1lg65]|uniref:YdcF family protein n=1 Tax=Pseudoalteromonas sp. T1lg65 TaxID=2077101 RepID=UPI003F7A3EFE
MFVTKKVIGQLVMPLPLSLLCLLVFMLFVAKSKKRPYIGALVVIVFLWFIATPFFAQFVLSSSNHSLQPFNAKKHDNIDKIVVLGCDIYPSSTLPSNAQLGGCSLSRLVEGVRLAKLYPNAKLIVSGAGFGATTNSSLMSNTAVTLGIESKRIIQNPSARDTAEEASSLAPKLVDFDVALVTSAYHMKRATDLFAAQGIEVVSAPTEYTNFVHFPEYRMYIPNIQALMSVTQVWHEQIGLLWIDLRRLIDPESI